MAKSGKSLKSTGSSRMLLLKNSPEKGDSTEGELNDTIAECDYNVPLKLTELVSSLKIKQKTSVLLI